MSAPMKCITCGIATRSWISARDINRHITDEVFEYRRCDACGTISLDPVPESTEKYYDNDYYQFASTDAERLRAASFEEYKIELVRAHVSSGELLEIGPGQGGFAFLARRAGYTVSVIEQDLRSAVYLRDSVGATLLGHEENLVEQMPGRFDVVALWHVIEHLRDPWRMFDACARALRPNGCLVIAAPNPAALQLRVLGSRWVHIDAPRHLHLLPFGALAQRALACGLRIEEATGSDLGSTYWTRFGWEESLAILARRRVPRGILRRVGRVVSVVASPFERELASAAYTMVFRRG